MGSLSLHVGVVGDGTLFDALSGYEADRSLTVESLTPEAITTDMATGDVDCLVVDGSVQGVDGRRFLGQVLDERQGRAVVLLADGWDDEQVASALSAGATAVLPRHLLETDPALIADRVVTTAGSDHSQRSFRELFESVSDGLVVHDPETGEIRDVNERYCQVTGYDREELVGSNVRQIVPDDPAYTYEEALSRIERARREGPQLFEFKGQRKDGDTFVGEIHLNTVTIHGQERVLASVRDVTDRKRREQAIRTLQEGTARMQDVDSTAAVAEMAVETTAEVLDLQLAACWFHDDDRLEPVAATDAVHEAELLSPLAPDRFEYEVFSDGDVTTYSPAEEDPANPVETALLLPLGDHGLIAAGKSDQTAFDRVPLDVARTLAEHVTTALDRVERERERRQSERRFRLIADRIEEVIFLAEPDFSELFYVNTAYEDIWGEPIEELYDDPQGFIEYIDPRDRADFEAAFEAMIADIDRGEAADSYTFEYRVRREDGSIRWVHVTGYPVELNGADAGSRFVGIAEDVTERRELERTYRSVFENVSDGLVIHDPETGEIRQVNDRFCQMNGYDRDDLLGNTIDLVTGPDYDYQRTKAYIRAAQEEGPQLFEWQNQRPDGETFPVEVHLSVVTIRGEERVLASVRNITERRRTERRLGAILDRIDEAIFITRAAEITSPSQSPDYVSSGYEDIWGRTLEEIRETYEDGFFGTLHPDDEADYRAFVDGIVDDILDGATANRYSREYRIEHPDAEVRWVHSDFYPTEWDDDQPRIVIVSRDITDRKARERRIASFDEATDDLTTVDTPEEATRTAVEAATETLDLPAVGVFRYDDDEGVLESEVVAGPLPAAVTADPIGPDDGPIWEGFVSGTLVGPDDRRSERATDEESDTAIGTALDDLAEWRVLALGTHGVLLVGSPDESLGVDAIQATHVLAATLEAALNHFESKQRLAAQQERLRTQTQRAERLDRIARLTQQVEAAITDASDPDEVERAVCDRLAGTGPYDLAWVGGVDVGTDRLTPHAVVGTSSQYVDSLDMTISDDTADPHPAVEAWRTGDVQVVESLVGDGPIGSWRRRSLSEGYQSLCAIPLTDDGITHGVLTVGSDSPDDFSARDREVFAQLGTSIANAIAAIERRRALESDETVELEFHGAGESLPFARAAAAADCQVRLERTFSRQDGSVSVYFSFEGDVENALEIAQRTLPGSVDVVTEASSSTLVETHTDEWFGTPLAEYGGVLREAIARPEATTITVEVPRQADIRSFVQRLEEIAPSLTLEAKRQHRQRDRTPAEISDRVREELTARQFEVLQTALSAGYFEWPREHDGGEVASQLDITQPTFNKHLRIAERKLFTLLLDET